jgi:hypothetical protein
MVDVEQRDEHGFIRLPRDQQGVLLPFSTKNHKYRVIRPGEPIGIARYLEYERLQIPTGLGTSFAEITDAIKRVETLLGSDGPLAEVRTEAILTLNSLRRGIIDLSRSRYSKALYMATIFIYRDGDNPKIWEMERATDYLNDWQEAGLSEQDFFMFSLAMVKGFTDRYNDLRAEAERTAVKLTGITTTETEEPSL